MNLWKSVNELGGVGSGRWAYRAADSQPAGFTDISSIKNWDEHGPPLIGKFANFMDFECLRSAISAEAAKRAGTGWSDWGDMDSEEKNIVFNYFAAPIARLKDIAVMSEMILVCRDVSLSRMAARQSRFTLAQSEIMCRLTEEEATEVANEMCAIEIGIAIPTDAQDLTTAMVPVTDMLGTYIQFGLTFIIDYVDGTTGTGFEGSGLRDKAFVPDGMTLNQLCDRIIDILNGIY